MLSRSSAKCWIIGRSRNRDGYKIRLYSITISVQVYRLQSVHDVMVGISLYSKTHPAFTFVVYRHYKLYMYILCTLLCIPLVKLISCAFPNNNIIMSLK